MKIGLVALPNSPEHYLEFAAKRGFQHIELDLLSTKQDPASFTPERIAALKAEMDRRGIGVSTHLSYTINPADNVAEVRRAVVDYVTRALEITHGLGGTWATIHIGYCIGLQSWDWLRAQGLERLIVTLKSILPACEKYQVDLALENVGSQPSDSSLVYLGDSVEDFKKIFGSLPPSHLKMCLDVGHANISSGFEAYFEYFADRIITTHVHDNRGKQDEHLWLGQGTVDWEYFLQAARNSGFQGPLNIELYDDEAKSRGREFLNRYLGKKT